MDESARRRPLSRRNDPSYDTLYEFVPAWLQASLWAWVDPLLHYLSHAGYPITNEDKLHALERRLHIEFDWTRGAGNVLDQLKLMMRHDKAGKFALDVVDQLLADMPVTSYRDGLNELEQSLKESGSAWTVVVRGDIGGLEQRVDATVAGSAAKVMEESGRAGVLLADAWRAVYGRSPNASSGYRDAVRAVEAAAKPIVSPNNQNTTLGTIIRDIEAAPQKWTLRLLPAGGVNPMATLLNMIKLLWKAQFDRHGTPDENVPINVSNEEAETALHLATTLVQWFARGAVKRVG